MYYVLSAIIVCKITYGWHPGIRVFYEIRIDFLEQRRRSNDEVKNDWTNESCYKRSSLHTTTILCYVSAKFHCQTTFFCSSVSNFSSYINNIRRHVSISIFILRDIKVSLLDYNNKQRVLIYYQTSFIFYCESHHRRCSKLIRLYI